MRLSIASLLTCSLVAAGGGAKAGEADVVDASALRTAENTYTFSVTVKHTDTGWDHYADRWQVLGPDGAVLGERILLHPHETEQPFTRELSGLAIPEGVDEGDDTGRRQGPRLRRRRVARRAAGRGGAVTTGMQVAQAIIPAPRSRRR